MTRPLLIALLLATGCAVQTSMVRSVERVPLEAVPHKPFRESKLWVRQFSHKAITDVSTAFAVSSNGTTATGLAVTRGTFDAPPTYVIDAVEKTGAFRIVTPLVQGADPDFVLEGQITAHWDVPWWSWAQWIDLCVHAWVFPTLGRTITATADVRLYDLEHQLLRRWKVEYRKSYVGQLWWMLSHGGAGDVGTDVAFQREVVDYAFDEIGKQLAAERTDEARGAR